LTKAQQHRRRTHQRIGRTCWRGDSKRKRRDFLRAFRQRRCHRDRGILLEWWLSSPSMEVLNRELQLR